MTSFPFALFANVVDVDEPEPTGKPDVYVNYCGVKQLMNEAGEDVCIACLEPYTNRGEGMLCHRCRILLKDVDFS